MTVENCYCRGRLKVAWEIPVRVAVAGAAADRVWKGEEDMTKSKASQRAKANAAEKAKKRAAKADHPAQTIRPGQFDPRDKSISSPRAIAGGKNFAAMKRGAARSR